MDQGNQRSDSQSEKENIGNLKEFNEIVNYLMQNKLTTPEGYYFSNPDPYLKPTPLPPDHPRHNFWFDEDGHICVKNPSAFWLPEFTLQKEIGGTIYSVTGTYDGTETLDKKMERIMAEKFTEKLEDSE